MADSPEMAVARAALEKAIVEYARVKNADVLRRHDDGSMPEDQREPEISLDSRRNGTPIVMAWACAYEWTNMKLEQDSATIRDHAVPLESTASNVVGLGTWLRDFFS